MKKNWLVLILVIVLGTTMLVGCKDNKDNKDTDATTEETDETESKEEVTDEETDEETEPAADEGKVLRIYCWNEEFQDRFDDYYASDLPEGIEVEWVITPNEDNAYQDKLDQDLLNQDSAADDEKIDIFLVEA